MINFYSYYNKSELLGMSHIEKDVRHLRIYGIGNWWDYSTVMHIIKSDTYFSYYYAIDYLKGRFIEGEPAIMKSPNQIYHYAKEIIKGRWSEAEEHIMKDPEYIYLYARDVIKGRWWEAEDVIKRSPYSYWYVRDVIKGRWREAEDVLRVNEYIWRNYCNTFRI